MQAEATEDFRHRMCCQDCWAYYVAVPGGGPHCRIGREECNRPLEVPPSRTRMDIDFIMESETLHSWPCEYRYSLQEVRLMQSGEWHRIRVNRKTAEKILGLIRDDMHLGYHWGY